jgi:rhodanese-related sulfurtransferase
LVNKNKKNMNWTAFLIVAAVVVGFLVVKRSGQISAKDARAHLKSGALVIDVRTAGEFSGGHLATAINIPLDQLETILPQRVTNKNQVLLLHCASGMRSGLAKSRLIKLGYTNTFNLGSYGRAESVLKSGR